MFTIASARGRAFSGRIYFTTVLSLSWSHPDLCRWCHGCFLNQSAPWNPTEFGMQTQSSHIWLQHRKTDHQLTANLWQQLPAAWYILRLAGRRQNTYSMFTPIFSAMSLSKPGTTAPRHRRFLQIACGRAPSSITASATLRMVYARGTQNIFFAEI